MITLIVKRTFGWQNNDQRDIIYIGYDGPGYNKLVCMYRFRINSLTKVTTVVESSTLLKCIFNIIIINIITSSFKEWLERRWLPLRCVCLSPFWLASSVTTGENKSLFTVCASVFVCLCYCLQSYGSFLAAMPYCTALIQPIYAAYIAGEAQRRWLMTYLRVLQPVSHSNVCLG